MILRKVHENNRTVASGYYKKCNNVCNNPKKKKKLGATDVWEVMV